MSREPAFGPREQVFFAFGVAGRDELPASVLVAMLTDLGMSAAGARSQLRRMEGRGALQRRAEGRRTHYRPAGPSRAAFRSVRDRLRPVPWEGHFHALFITVPERERGFRDDLRRRARLLGYGTLRPGALVHPADHHQALLESVGPAPEGTRSFSGRLVMDEAEAREAAREAWDLDALRVAYEQQIRRLSRASAPHSTPDGATLRACRDAMLPALGCLLGGPQLPDALLPPDWPLAELTASIDAAHHLFATPLKEYVDALIGA